MQTKIVFFGSSAYVIPILQQLQEHFLLSLVITTEKNPIDAVPQYCTSHSIPFLSVSSLKNHELEQELQNSNAPLAVLADFGIIIPTSILQLFPKGIINIHPSLLPHYRGSTPGHTAIANGDTKTGISIMRLDNKLDHGPILAQQEEEILPTDTAKTLYERLFIQGAHLLIPTLTAYLSGNLMTEVQDESHATYTQTLSKESGYIDNLNPPTKEKLHNLIRAYFPWPGVWTKINLYGKEKIVKLLPQNMLQVEGKKPMTVKDFLNGYPDAKDILLRLHLL